jgi:hypothetical protein
MIQPGPETPQISDAETTLRTMFDQALLKCGDDPDKLAKLSQGMSALFGEMGLLLQDEPKIDQVSEPASQKPVIEVEDGEKVWGDEMAARIASHVGTAQMQVFQGIYAAYESSLEAGEKVLSKPPYSLGFGEMREDSQLAGFRFPRLPLNITGNLGYQLTPLLSLYGRSFMSAGMEDVIVDLEKGIDSDYAKTYWCALSVDEGGAVGSLEERYVI